MDNQLFKNKYRTKSIRLANWDYSSNGAYYITICTKNREYLFGNIINGKMTLNDIGEIINQCWYDLPNHYENCKLDEFVIMPDHVHGIVIIDNNNVLIPVEAIHVEAGLKPASTNNHSKRHSLFEIIRGFKTFSSRKINKMQNLFYFQWQRDYFEHIIRNEIELNQKRKYIINNPSKWEINHS